MLADPLCAWSRLNINNAADVFAGMTREWRTHVSRMFGGQLDGCAAVLGTARVGTSHK